MVLIATFNNMSALSWLSVLMVEETGVPGENHDLPQIPDKLHQIMLHRVHIVMSGIQANNLSDDMH
jgi:hypothetical protein